MTKCDKCNGCGKIADSEGEEPWTTWTALPLQSSAVVLLGIVKPKVCPKCGGIGSLAHADEILGKS